MVLSDAALELAQADWKVFPVDAKTKRPRTKHGHLEATSSVHAVTEWGPLFNNAGAIATPTGDGLLVIDIDPRNGGQVPHWAPPTLTVRTQSGGLHLYYNIDGDIKSRAGLFGPGVDSKCAGGYVLVPPSPGYEWVHMSPRIGLNRDWLQRYYCRSTVTGADAQTRRLPPTEWRRGIIHDQVVAWAAWAAGESSDARETEAFVWSLVDQAKQAGIQIDNAGGHIGVAIQWVLDREHA